MFPRPLVPASLCPSDHQPSPTFPSSENSGHLSPPKGHQPHHWGTAECQLVASPLTDVLSRLPGPRLEFSTFISKAQRCTPPNPAPRDHPSELKARCSCGLAAPPALVSSTGWTWRRGGIVCRPGVWVGCMAAGERDSRQNLEARPCVLLSCPGRGRESDGRRGRAAQTSGSARAEKGAHAGPRARRSTGTPVRLPCRFLPEEAGATLG